MSRFAGSVQTVRVDIPLKECLLLIPKELVIEIFSYLEMGIILDLGSRDKTIILQCIKYAFKLHRIPVHVFDIIYRNLDVSMIISHVLKLCPRFKILIMKQYIEWKVAYHEAFIRKKKELILQDEIFANIKVSDFVFHKYHHYTCLVVKKCKKSLKCIYIRFVERYQEIVIHIDLRMGYDRFLKSSLFVNETKSEPLNSAHIIRYQLYEMAKTYDSFDVYSKNQHVGHFMKEDLAKEIVDYYERLPEELALQVMFAGIEGFL